MSARHLHRANAATLAALLASALLGACGSSPMPPDRSGASQSVQGVEYGTVRAVEAAEDRPGGSGAGAVIGGVVGGVAGNQVGSGDGRKAATVAGVIGGAVLGNEIEKRRRSEGNTVQYIVDMDNGDQRTYRYATDQALSVGQRVRVVDGLLQPW